MTNTSAQDEWLDDLILDIYKTGHEDGVGNYLTTVGAKGISPNWKQQISDYISTHYIMKEEVEKIITSQYNDWTDTNKLLNYLRNRLSTQNIKKEK